MTGFDQYKNNSARSQPGADETTRYETAGVLTSLHGAVGRSAYHLLKRILIGFWGKHEICQAIAIVNAQFLVDDGRSFIMGARDCTKTSC